jgi:preprotein translocase subunit SecF
MNLFTAIIPSLFIGVLVLYAFSVGTISLNNLTLLFIGVTIGTAASIFKSKKGLIEKSKKSQDSNK